MITLNGLTLTDLGVQWVGCGNNWGGYSPGLQTTPRGLRIGAAVSEYGSVGPGLFEVIVRVPPPESGHQAIMDALRGWLVGLIEIEETDRSNRRLYGILQADDGAGEWLPFVDASGARRLSLQFMIPNPTWFAKYTRSIVLAADTPKEITGLGTVPSWFEVIAPGAVTDFDIDLLGPDGAVLSSLHTTGVISSGEYIRIDMGQELVAEGTGGAEVDRHSFLTGAYGGFFAIDPGDGVCSLLATDACVVHIQDAYK